MRSTYKTTILVLSLAESLARFHLLRVRTGLQRHREPGSRDRALWLHGCCRRIVERLQLSLTANAALPTRGLVVSNHLSHLDILLYGALAPVIFVAKEEVRGWPLLGRLAEYGGTVFVDRESPAQAAIAAQQMETHLRGETPVLLFPEGTSSDGTSVLPFHSPLFEAAIRAQAPITAAAITYSAEGVDETALTYWGDRVFFTHLYATLGCKNLSGNILFAESRNDSNRKEAARNAHALVSSLRERDTVTRSHEAQCRRERAPYASASMGGEEASGTEADYSYKNRMNADARLAIDSPGFMSAGGRWRLCENAPQPGRTDKAGKGYVAGRFRFHL